mmetsp:Transcript_6644/g.26975  ORF Transcript_6644/g.26975 Transcript_6644/m.26975 type:complete len:449 (+) Transcript_6644:828-2174(+)
MERTALKVRDLHLELRHLLGAVSAALRHDTGNVHDSAGVHGVRLTGDVAPGEPAMLAVEHAGVVSVAGHVVGVRARRVTSFIRGVEHLGQLRQRRHAIARLDLFRKRISAEGVDRALHVLATGGLGVSASEHRLERRLVGRRSSRGRLAKVNLTAGAGTFFSLLRARIRRRRLAHVLQARAQGDAALEGHRLDAHEARRDGLGEYRLTLLFAFQVRGADVRRAVGDVREGPVGLLTRQHLELRHHLVVAAATLGHDGRDGANLAGIDGEVLPGGVCAREPSFTAVEHAREVAVARLVVVQRRRRAAGFVRRVQQLGLGKRRQVLDGRVLDHLQAAAHGDVSSVSLGLDPDVSRRDGLQEQRLDLVVAPLAVADERGAVVNLHVRAAELVRHRHLVDLDVLVLVLAVLHDDAHDGHHVPGVHDVELLVVVPAGKPALVAVEHAGVVAVA